LLFFADRHSPASPVLPLYGTLKGLDQSMNPQLMKYSRETDVSIALARKENRRRLFSLYPQMPVSTPKARTDFQVSFQKVTEVPFQSDKIDQNLLIVTQK